MRIRLDIHLQAFQKPAPQGTFFSDHPRHHARNMAVRSAHILDQLPTIARQLRQLPGLRGGIETKGQKLPYQDR